jgi:hypothetical protein
VDPFVTAINLAMLCGNVAAYLAARRLFRAAEAAIARHLYQLGAATPAPPLSLADCDADD